LIGTTKVSCHTIWTDLSAGGVNPADIDGQSKARLFTLWKDFSTGQKYAKCKEGQTSGEGENPRVDLARPVKQGLMGWPGYTGSERPRGTAYMLVPPSQPPAMYKMCLHWWLQEPNGFVILQPYKIPRATAVMDGMASTPFMLRRQKRHWELDNWHLDV
jgi:hypothetical protein